MTHVVRSTHELIEMRKSWNQKSVGFVPTMGALHAGHTSLLKTCRQQNDITVLSIFVNPTQFNDKNDFTNYPKTFEHDLQIAKENNVDVVFCPIPQEMYPDDFRFQVTENAFSNELCGAHRPGHFTGVLTVVLKLLNIVRPTRAYFGEKDYQQFQLIKDMSAALFLGTEIIMAPTVREIDGLAMSSRNVRLNDEARKKAPEFYQTIKNSKTAIQAIEKLNQLGFQVDYVEDIQGRRYAAVHLNQVRLIDNVEI